MTRMRRTARTAPKEHPARLKPQRIAGQVRGRADSVTSSLRSGPQRDRRRASATWLIAILGTVISTILATTLTAIPGQILNLQRIGDWFRGGEDVVIAADSINDDSNFAMAFPEIWDPPAGDPTSANLDVQVAERLVGEERAAGAYALYDLRVRIVLEGNRNEQIQITDLIVTNMHVGPRRASHERHVGRCARRRRKQQSADCL
jgi:hypothetical protein